MVLVLTLVVTKLVDLVKLVVDPAESRVPKVFWLSLAFVFGIILAFVWDWDYLNWPTRILYGLGLGAAGSAWHELLKLLSYTAAKNRALAAAPAPRPTVKAR